MWTEEKEPPKRIAGGVKRERRDEQQTPKRVGGLDRCLLIRFLRVFSVVEHRKPTETVEAEIQPSDGFPYRRTEPWVVPHLLSWHSGRRPLFGMSFTNSTASATTLSDPSSYVGVERFLPAVSIPRKTATSRPPIHFLLAFCDIRPDRTGASPRIHLT